MSVDDRESPLPLLLLPIQQIVYRQVMYLVLAQALSSRRARVRDGRPAGLRILVTGASGHLGSRVASRAGAEVVGTCFGAASEHERLDIRDLAAVRALVRRVRPDVVIHAAAGRSSWPTIADGAAHVALAASEAGSRLVHVSSDAIFSGSDTAYDESATPDPLYLYGAAKAAAETAVTAIAGGAVVVRTSLILGDGDGQHERLTHDLAGGGARGALFTDMIRMPVHADDLAGALLELAAGDYRGILNVTGPDAISRYDLGVLIARRDGLDPDRIPASTIAGAGLRMAATVRLDTGRAVAMLRTRLRGVRELLSAQLEQVGDHGEDRG